MQNPTESRIDLVKIQKDLFKEVFCQKDEQSSWKVMIFDQANLDVASTLMRLKDFRENNITLYFNINQHREQIHGVPAIYLVKPTLQNVNLIIGDFEEDLYSSVVVHFSSEPTAHLLSSFAKNASKIKSASSKIKKVFYSNIGFQSIDRQMCILPEDGELLNFLGVLKNEPIFIYSGSEQQRVRNLRQKLLNSSFGSRSFQEEEYSFKKPKKYTKVLIFNRQNDLFPVVGHGITYASLMEDVWKFNKTGTKILDKKQQIDLNDEIWLQRKNMLMSEMELERQLSKIKGKIMSLNSKMQEFSELPEKQKRIQWHLDNVTQIIGQATKRRLNEFHAVEEDLYIKKMLSGDNKKEFIELLATGPNYEDKVRLMLAYLVCTENYDQNQVQELENVFPGVKKHNFYNELKTKKMKNQCQQNANSKYIKKLAKGIWKNLVNQEKKYMVVKYLQKAKDLSQRNLSQLGLRIASLSELPQNPKIQSSVIYCIGGICFNEYANLAQFDPNVIYTGDKFINHREFV